MFETVLWHEGRPQGSTHLIRTSRVPTHGRVPRPIKQWHAHVCREGHVPRPVM